VHIGYAGDLCGITCPFSPLRLVSNQTRVLSDPSNSTPLASPTGLILHIQNRQIVPGAVVRFNFRVRDLSRQASTWGTELPVVRASDFTAEPIQLLNLPTDPRFRFTVRIFAIEGPSSISARVRVHDLLSGRVLRELPLTLQRFGQPAAYYPAYAQLDSLSPELANLGSDRVGIEVSPSDSMQKLWAFVTVTNNDSQHVTTVTLQ
jgi:hypothetical protein